MSSAKKKVFTFLLMYAFLSLFSAKLFAFSGLSGEGKIKVSTTSYFDIIYTQKSELAAKVLYENADSIFVEVAGLYGREPSFNIPVVLIPSVEKRNAFFSPFPYNHIVIYDTSDSELNDLSYFSEGLLYIFRHELTHAVTYNLKNNFWKAIGNIFGDVCNLGYLSVSSGIAESAAVTSESYDGEGRLNNEFSRHPVKQAKIENKFPKFYDVQGSRDVYLVSSFYYFNSAFAQWLQENYGMEKYAQFWYKLVNFQKLTPGSAFKNVYGIKLNDAWKKFYEDYEVPQVEENPVEQKLVKDFFKTDSENFSIENNSGSLYSSLVSSENKLFWFEASSGKIQYADLSENNESKKIKNFLTVRNAENLGVSGDGKFLAVTYLSQNSKSVKSKVSIYDTKKKNHITLKGHGQKNASIVKNQNDYYLICQNYYSPNVVIEIYKIIFSSSGRLKSAEKVNEVKLDMDVFAASFAEYDDGIFSFIKKEGIAYSICLMDIQGKLIADFKMPYEDMILQELSVSDEKEILFNYVQKGTMPRVGKVTVGEEKAFTTADSFTSAGENSFTTAHEITGAKSFITVRFELSSLDLSGGIFFPNKIRDEIFYVGNFYEQNRILVLSEEKAWEEDVAENRIFVVENSSTVVNASIVSQNSSAAGNDSTALENQIPSHAFNPFKYLSKGLFVPLSIYKSSSFGSNTNSSFYTQYYPLGITYVTGLPWTDSSNSFALFTAGYGYFSDAFGFDLLLKSSTDTQLLSCSEEFKFEVDRYGPKQLAAILNAQSIVQTGRISYFAFNNSFEGYYGKQDDFTVQHSLDYLDKNATLSGITMPTEGTTYTQLLEMFSIAYSNIHKTGSGRFENLGFSIGGGAGYLFSIDNTHDKTLYNYPAVSGTAKISLPALIPVKNYKGLVYNLPFNMTASLLPSRSNFGGSAFSSDYLGVSVLDFDAQVVLFGFEVQKAIPFIPAVYFNNMYFTAGYNSTVASFLNTKGGFQIMNLPEYFSGLSDNSSLYLDSAYVTMNIGLTPNYGVLANRNLKIDIYGKMNFAIRKFFLQKTDFTIDIGFNANF